MLYGDATESEVLGLLMGENQVSTVKSADSVTMAAEKAAEAAPTPALAPAPAPEVSPAVVPTAQPTPPATPDPVAEQQERWRRMRAQKLEEENFERLRKKAAQAEELEQLAKKSPLEVLKALGITPDATAKSLLTEAKPKDPTQARFDALEAQNAALLRRLEERDAREKEFEQAQALANKKREVYEYLQKGEAPELTKTLATPELVLAVMNNAMETTGQPISIAQAAAQVEQSLEADIKKVAALAKIQKMLQEAGATPPASAKPSMTATATGPVLGSSQSAGVSTPADPNASAEDLMAGALEILKHGLR